MSPLCRLARWLSAAPAALAGLGTRKGQIAPATKFSRGERVWDKHRLGRAYGGRLL